MSKTTNYGFTLTDDTDLVSKENINTPITEIDKLVFANKTATDQDYKDLLAKLAALESQIAQLTAQLNTGLPLVSAETFQLPVQYYNAITNYVAEQGSVVIPYDCFARITFSAIKGRGLGDYCQRAFLDGKELSGITYSRERVEYTNDSGNTLHTYYYGKLSFSGFLPEGGVLSWTPDKLYGYEPNWRLRYTCYKLL